MLNNI